MDDPRVSCCPYNLGMAGTITETNDKKEVGNLQVAPIRDAREETVVPRAMRLMYANGRASGSDY